MSIIHILLYDCQMVQTKTELFEPDVLACAAVAKALAHPARIAILKLLAEKQSCICGEIVDELPLAQATVSQHLKELKAAGLIKGEIAGPKVCYCIDAEGWKQSQRLLLQLFAHTECCTTPLTVLPIVTEYC